MTSALLHIILNPVLSTDMHLLLTASKLKVGPSQWARHYRVKS